MAISKFWKTLDVLTGAGTDRRDWAMILGAEFDSLAVQRPGSPRLVIRASGMLAETISCPSPGGDGCPRRVIHHGDGTVRAICGDHPKSCEDLNLQKTDLHILEVDRAALGAQIALALNLSGKSRIFGAAAVFKIGHHNVAAGKGFPVYLTIPGPGPNLDLSQFDDLLAGGGPRLLLLPTSSSLPAQFASRFDRHGVTCMALDRLLDVGHGQFQLRYPVSTAFADLRTKVANLAELTAPVRAWNLPDDATWEEISIRFVADEAVNVSFRSQVRRFEPDILGMKSALSGKPTTAWSLLKTFARQNGRLPVHATAISNISKYQKQKQALSKALRAAFGISAEPFPAVGEDYVARLVISAVDLDQGKQGQAQRNFVDTSMTKRK